MPVMHPALQIQEILLIIFDHHRRGTYHSCLPALARTCRAFKEPALDVLWELLRTPSPLARCLPEASQSRQIDGKYHATCYSFSRSLSQKESDILRSYTRRIRSMSDTFGPTLDWESVANSLNPPTTEPLFPNLRHLYYDFSTENEKLLYMPFPSLITLKVDFRLDNNGTLAVLQHAFESFSEFSSNIRRLTVHNRHGVRFGNFFSNRICLWQNLQSVDCVHIALNVDALVHLSRMTALTQLTFRLHATVPGQITPPNSPLTFSSLHQLSLHSNVLKPISQLLFHTRLPAVTHLCAIIRRRPSKLDVTSFLSNAQALGIGRTIQELVLEQTFPDDHVIADPRPILGSGDLLPCTTFSKLHHVAFNVEWDVDLTSSEMLLLASAWPHMEELNINRNWGWNTQGGITPDDLAQLLQRCQSLSYIAVAIDTRGTTFRRSPVIHNLVLRPRDIFDLNVVDSFIEEESVPAMAALLASFVMWTDFDFYAWLNVRLREDMGCRDLWGRAYTLAKMPFLRMCRIGSYRCTKPTN